MIENLGYLISSHKDYTEPRTRLLMSMQGIDPERIVAIVGGYVSEERRMWHRPIACVTHNSYDYTALIDYVEHPDDYPRWSHVFLLHDTMELGPESDRLIRSADPSLDAVAAWGGECNLGLYRADYLHERAAEILALKNCTKLQAVGAEGFLWRTCAEAQRGVYPGGIDIGESEATYGGAARQRVYYAGVDIVKWKANWGQDWPPSVATP